MEAEERQQIDSMPTEICIRAITRLADSWDDVRARAEDGPVNFIKSVLSMIWRDGATGEECEAELAQWHEKPEPLSGLILLQAVVVCFAYACQGIKAQQDSDMTRAWQYTAKCEYWLGIVVGAWSIRSTQDAPAKAFARLGADARHAENRSMKTQVREWYAANAQTLGSKDAAAEKAAGKLVPVKFRTGNQWNFRIKAHIGVDAESGLQRTLGTVKRQISTT